MDEQPASPQQQRRPPVPPGCVEVGQDEQRTDVALGPPHYLTTELLQVGYRRELTRAVDDRLYPRVRQLIRDLPDEFRLELAELNPQLILTSVND